MGRGGPSMRDEDPFAKPEPKKIPFQEWSIEDLEARILDLRQEILDIEALVKTKKASKLAADAVFGKPPSH
jgi:uncharacterized small protein (DUF1192 family)